MGNEFDVKIDAADTVTVSVKSKENTKIDKIKEYLEDCISLYERGVRYGIKRIAYDINVILDSQE